MTDPERRTQPRDLAAARLAASWLLSYPDSALLSKLDQIAAVVAELPEPTGQPLAVFLQHLNQTSLRQMQEHYVAIFDMRRRACPYLSYWSDGDTRNRGAGILRFKQAYQDAGYEVSDAELPDHIAVVLEFAAIGEPVTGDALLCEHAHAIGLLRDALTKMGSVYVHVLDSVVATLPAPTPEVEERMAQIAATGPGEQVGLPGFSIQELHTIGARR